MQHKAGQNWSKPWTIDSGKMGGCEWKKMTRSHKFLYVVAEAIFLHHVCFQAIKREV
jgi:hypothetical protein